MLLVAAGGGIGSAARYAVYLYSRMQPFPYATLFINLVGSFLLGIFMGLGLEKTSGESYRLLFAVGICGGFTTFSTFSFENVKLLQAGRYNLFFIYVFTSVITGIIAAWLGFKLINHQIT